MPKFLWKIWPMKNFDAIVLPWGLYFRPGLKVSTRLMRHEQEHIKQIKEDGAWYFYSRYLLEFLMNFVKYGDFEKAYYYISYEMKARRAERA
jgi:hypothetical protein